MPIWTTPMDLESLNASLQNTLGDHLGMKITEVGDDYLKITMPVDKRTWQPLGIVHGGASVALAETAGSVAANHCCKPGYHCVGVDINANHIRPGMPPYLTATATPLHIGGSTMVWEIRITDVQDRLVCASRLMLAVLKKDGQCADDSQNPSMASIEGGTRK